MIPLNWQMRKDRNNLCFSNLLQTTICRGTPRVKWWCSMDGTKTWRVMADDRMSVQHVSSRRRNLPRRHHLCPPHSISSILQGWKVGMNFLWWSFLPTAVTNVSKFMSQWTTAGRRNCSHCWLTASTLWHGEGIGGRRGGDERPIFNQGSTEIPYAIFDHLLCMPFYISHVFSSPSWDSLL